MFDPSTTARGARREFELFYREQFPGTWRTLSRLGVAPRDCEDAAQEVFITAYRRWSSVRDPSHRRAWLVGIARRTAANFRRGSDRRARRLDAVATLAVSTTSMDPELLRREAWRALQGFLDALEPAKRDAFVLGELEELTRPELAEALGVRPSTAYSRLEVARRQFVAHFAALGEEGSARVLVHGVPELPSSQQTARGWALLVPMIGAALPSTAIALPVFAKLAIGFVLAGGVGVVAIDRLQAPAESPSQHRVEQRARESTAVASTTVVAALPPAVEERAVLPPAQATEHVATSPRAVKPIALPPAPIAQDDESAAEVALLKSARSAALAGDAELAREQLSEHRRRFGDDTRLAELRAEIARAIDDGIVSAPPSGHEIDEEHR